MMINKINIINKNLENLYALKDDIYMNIGLNNSLELPVQENTDDLNRCLQDTNDKIDALNQELNRVLLEGK
jgi:ABC-type phosphate transport system auxiliary subunit